MVTAITRKAYFQTGLDVLSEMGYGGLKLAEVCKRLGVTTGSFYHYFDNWSAYTRELLQHWLETLTVQLVEFVRAIPDPRERIGALIEIGRTLPYGAEGAIRAWSFADSAVYAVQAQVDKQRFDIIVESAREVLRDQRQAELFATWSMYLLVGCEQVQLPRDDSAIVWITGELLAALDSGRFAGAAATDHSAISRPTVPTAAAHPPIQRERMS